MIEWRGRYIPSAVGAQQKFQDFIFSSYHRLGLWRETSSTNAKRFLNVMLFKQGYNWSPKRGWKRSPYSVARQWKSNSLTTVPSTIMGVASLIFQDSTVTFPIPLVRTLVVQNCFLFIQSLIFQFITRKRSISCRLSAKKLYRPENGHTKAR